MPTPKVSPASSLVTSIVLDLGRLSGQRNEGVDKAMVAVQQVRHDLDDMRNALWAIVNYAV